MTCFRRPVLVVLSCVMVFLPLHVSPLQLCAALHEVMHELNSCYQHYVVMLSGENRQQDFMDHGISLFLSTSGIPFYHHVISNVTTSHLNEDDVKSIIRKHLSTNQHTTFLITTTHFDDIMHAAVEIWREEERQSGKLWLHVTRWLILTSGDQVEADHYFLSQNLTFPMDNIAIASTSCNFNDDKKETLTPKIRTLTWNPDRTRRIERVCLGETNTLHGNNCRLFPNLQYGLNGRHFQVITKVHWGFFVFVKPNHQTGIPEYGGYVIDILEALAEALNFTYTLQPYPDPRSQATWDEVAYNVTEGLVDFSATPWSYSWEDVFNISVSYPIVLDSFTGVYKQQKPSKESMSLYILCPFNSLTYGLLFAAMLYTLFAYMFIVGFVYRDEMSTRPRGLFYKHPPSRPSSSSSSSASCKQEGSVLSRMCRVLWYLAASVFNQAYLPVPSQMSARLVLFLWSISMVMFYAIYTGSLTAEMVESGNLDPVTSFEDLASRGDYSWGTTDNSILEDVMEKSSDGVLYDLRQRTQNIPDGEAGDIYPTLRHTIRHLGENFVFIQFKSLLTQIVGSMERPGDYAMIKDSLLSANQGFIFSTSSLLTPLVSRTVHRMHDAGVVTKLYNNYAFGNRTPDPDAAPGSRHREPLSLQDVQWPVYLVGALLVLALGVLVLERLWVPVLNLARKHR